MNLTEHVNTVAADLDLTSARKAGALAVVEELAARGLIKGVEDWTDDDARKVLEAAHAAELDVQREELAMAHALESASLVEELSTARAELAVARGEVAELAAALEHDREELADLAAMAEAPDLTGIVGRIARRLRLSGRDHQAALQAARE